MSNHDMRATMISMLIDAGNYDSSIILIFGHINFSTLTNHNLSSLEGFRKKIALFSKSISTLPFSHVELSPFNK